MTALTKFQVLNHCTDWLKHRSISLPAKDRFKSGGLARTPVANAVMILLGRR